jgi:leucyl aminopeptidase (aminopeptidase T)
MGKNIKKEAIERLYNVNLGVQQGERILIFTDDKNKELIQISEEIAEVGSKFGKIDFFCYPQVGEHGVEPPLELWEKAFGVNIIERFKNRGLLLNLLKKEAKDEEIKIAGDIVAKRHEEVVDVVIALSWFSTTHTKFRRLMTEFGETRYASMPLFSAAMFEGPMDVDYVEVAKLTNKIKKLLSAAHAAEIRTPNGTQLILYLEGREGFADTGILKEKGSFGNLPAGEAFIAPQEGKSEGILVIEYPAKIIAKIEEGKVKRLEGEKIAVRELEERLNKNPANRNLAEFGIGTNPKAKNVENILEAEKIAGSIHIALGDNSNFGGKITAPFHQDFVFFSPTVKLKLPKEEVIILENGDLKL